MSAGHGEVSPCSSEKVCVGGGVAHGRRGRNAQTSEAVLAGLRVQHRLLGVPQRQEAGQLALAAGVDVGISYESGFMDDMVQSIETGQANISDIDRSVRRVLRQKMRLGLFENPYVDAERAGEIVGGPRSAAAGAVATRRHTGRL